ncbi:MAG: hypothetical protein KGN84_22800 [Acidobacteriota bacterium]|nr:hypothetical protein [Acidobacteriota bacterium]
MLFPGWPSMSRVVGLIGAFLICCASPAATLQQLSLGEMTQDATAIVRARVTGSSARFTGSTIYTHYALQVTESWKGFAPAEVLVPGGVANGIRQSFPGVPELKVGTEYVLFLWTSRSTGITHIVGLQQGLFNIATQSDGSMLASRPLIGEVILDSHGRRVPDHAVSMALTALRSQVSHALIAGVPK